MQAKIGAGTMNRIVNFKGIIVNFKGYCWRYAWGAC